MGIIIILAKEKNGKPNELDTFLIGLIHVNITNQLLLLTILNTTTFFFCPHFFLCFIFQSILLVFVDPLIKDANNACSYKKYTTFFCFSFNCLPFVTFKPHKNKVVENKR